MGMLDVCIGGRGRRGSEGELKRSTEGTEERGEILRTAQSIGRGDGSSGKLGGGGTECLHIL